MLPQLMMYPKPSQAGQAIGPNEEEDVARWQGGEGWGKARRLRCVRRDKKPMQTIN